MAHSIDIYDFCVMNGTIPVARPTAEVIVRPGVDGTALRLNGRRGPAFNVSTVRDVADLNAGRNLLDSYNWLVGQNPVGIIQNDVDYWVQSGVLVAVLAVEPLQLRRASVIAGAIDSGSEAILRVIWHLQLVEA